MKMRDGETMKRKYPLLKIPQLEGKYAPPGESRYNGKHVLPFGKQFHKAVTIMRAKPPHRNHIAMLEALCQKSKHLTINIGSSNKMDEKNPFTWQETEEMMHLGLPGYCNFRIIPCPDSDDPRTGDGKWADDTQRIPYHFL